jgi:hypothetical protein
MALLNQPIDKLAPDEAGRACHYHPCHYRVFILFPGAVESLGR